MQPDSADLHIYESAVKEAIDSLPDHLRDALKDVAIVIEENPVGREDIARGRLLLGLYEGVPLTAWGRNFSGKMPDKITLFRGPISAIARSPEEIPHLVRETVWHEVGHYFGFGHDRIREMEKRWKKKRLDQ